MFLTSLDNDGTRLTGLQDAVLRGSFPGFRMGFTFVTFRELGKFFSRMTEFISLRIIGSRALLPFFSVLTEIISIELDPVALILVSMVHNLDILIVLNLSFSFTSPIFSL